MTVEIVQNPVECNSAEEFIEAISPIGNYFRKYESNNPWLFRGHGSNSYKLIPSALRPDRPLRKMTIHNCNDRGSQFLAERDVLTQFFLLADKRGLPLPEDSQDLRKLLETLNSSRGEYFLQKGDWQWWPRDELLSLLALAQHYGLPTRLLDWTKNSYIAAYFAAADAIKSKDGENDKLAVWSLYYPVMGTLDNIERWSQPVIIVTAPSATNANLRAQQGAFTLVNFVASSIRDIDCMPLDEVLASAAAKGDANARLSKMSCFTLPRQEASKLLWLLEKLDISASTLFPGYAGVVDELKQKVLSSPL